MKILKSTARTVISVVLFLVTSALEAKTVDIQIAAQSGELDSPSRSITVESALKELKEGHHENDDVTIRFPDGRIVLTRGILLTNQNARFKSLSLIGNGLDKSVLTGAVSIRTQDWSILSEIEAHQAGVPISHSGAWFTCRVPGTWAIHQNQNFKYGAGVSNDVVVVSENQRLLPAHLPLEPFQYFRVGTQNPKSFEILSQDHFAMDRLGDEYTVVDGLWRSSWQSARVPAAIFRAGNKVLLSPEEDLKAVEGQPFLIQSPRGIEGNERAFFLEANQRRLIVWRANARPPSETYQISSVASPLIEIRDLRNVTINSLSVECGQGELLRVVRGTNVTVKGVAFRFGGGRGLNLAGEQIKVEDCEVRETGAEGIYLTGGDRDRLIAAGSIISGCRILDTGQTYWSYHSGIQILNACGVLVEGNIIERAPHAGVVFTGNDIKVTNNRIREVCETTNDVGAIYTGGDWSSFGNSIENNRIENIHSHVPGPGVNGIYIDRAASGVVVAGNTLSNIENAGIFINGGRYNRICTNTVEDCGIGILLTDAAKDLYSAGDRSFIAGFLAQRKRNHSDVWRSRYPAIASYPEAVDGFASEHWLDPIGTEIQGNSMANCVHGLIVPQKTRHMEGNKVAKPEWTILGKATDVLVDGKAAFKVRIRAEDDSAPLKVLGEAARALVGEAPSETDWISVAEQNAADRHPPLSESSAPSPIVQMLKPFTEVSRTIQTSNQDLWISLTARSGDGLAPRNVSTTEYSVLVDGKIMPTDMNWKNISGPFPELGGAHWGEILFGPLKVSNGPHKVVIKNWIPWLAVRNMRQVKAPGLP